MGIAIVLFVIIWFLLWLTDNTPSQKLKKKLKALYEKEEINLKKCIDTHFDTLLIKWEQKVYNDDYGRVIFDDWDKEIVYFIQNIAFSDEDYVVLPNSILDAIKIFDKHWGTLINKHFEEFSDEKIIDIIVKNGIDYENFVEKHLTNQGFKISRTPKTGDQGVDLIAEDDGTRIAVQCKFYNKPVGNKAVQEVIAGRIFYQCDGAIVISNASFTKSARQLAENSGIELISLPCNSQ